MKAFASDRTNASEQISLDRHCLEKGEAMAEERTTVVKTGGSNIGLILLALAIVIAAAVGFLHYQSQKSKNDAIAGAASAVGDTAKKVGDNVPTTN